MSLINKMLQDLDRRNAMAPAGGPIPPQQVRAVRPAGPGREWFWRSVAVLVLIALSWVSWVAYQITPRPLVTDLALSVGNIAQRMATAKPTVKAITPAAPAPAAAPATPAAEPSAPPPSLKAAPVQQASLPPPELFKLALSIDTPITLRRVKTPAKSQGSPSAGAPQRAATLPAGKISKRELPVSTAVEAESLFRHGVALLNQGRISEAQEDFSTAILRHPRHEASRQALIAIRIERRQIDEARRLLEEGLVINPTQTQFAAVLARIHVELGDDRAAADVLAAAGGASPDDADFQLVRGAVLQRLGRHAEAAAAFEHTARLVDQPGAIWVALGISLEETGRKADALKAYRRSLAAPMMQEARTYAETRIRALD